MAVSLGTHERRGICSGIPELFLILSWVIKDKSNM